MTHAGLEAILDRIGPAALAVSGGIDSITLATVANRHLAGNRVFHAVSPAVPPRATKRVRRLAARQGWALTVLDAGEFRDVTYRSNPVDRCFYCKSNLYAAIAAQTDLPILSGTNLDDLDDFRPGLQAAAQHAVRHPFVEAGIGKAGIRDIARRAGLGALSELPAAPCLSSRVTTGLAIEPEHLQAIDRTEEALRAGYRVAMLRCRLTPRGYRIEIDADSLAALDPEAVMKTARAALGPGHRLVAVGPYRRGSVFLRSIE